MKELKRYYEIIKNSPFFSYIETEEDLLWLLRCTEGEVVAAESVFGMQDEAFAEDNGYYYVRLGDSGLLLRMSAMRAGKLCSFQCKFHRDLLDRIAEFESRVKA